MSSVSSKGISKRVVHGGMWMLALRITDRLFNLVRIIVLARLLTPNDFGLFGIALVAIMALKTFTKTGFQAALIQRKGEINDYLGIAWTVQTIRGALLAAILFITAPYISAFFNEAEATPILQVLGFSLLLQGMTHPGVVYFQKELEFRKLFVYEIIGTIADIVVSLTLAFYLQSVWALVYGLISRYFVQLVCSFLIVPIKIVPRLNLDKAKHLFNFGKWIFLSSILMFLLVQGPQIFVGKVLGTTVLGFYVLAFQIANMPTREVINIISRTTFPAYAKLQDEPSKLQKGYLRMFKTTSFFIIPATFGLFVLAKDFTQLFLGEKWMPIVPALQVLALWGGLKSIHTTIYPLLQGIGKPEIETKLKLIQIVLLGALIYPFTSLWGILGTCLAILLSELFTSPFHIYQLIRNIELHPWKFTKIAVFPTIGALIMAGAISLLNTFNTGLVGLFDFFVLAGAGILTYIGAAYVFDRFFNYGIIKTLDKYFIKAMRKT